MANKFLYLSQCLDHNVIRQIAIRINNVVDFEKYRGVDKDSKSRTKILLNYPRDGDHIVDSVIFVTQGFDFIKLLISDEGDKD